VISMYDDRRPKLDSAWENLLLSCIGEQFTNSGMVAGSVCQVRKKFCRVSVWVARMSDEERDVFRSELQLFLAGEDKGTTYDITYAKHG
jgi:hypothetical protein